MNPYTIIFGKPDDLHIQEVVQHLTSEPLIIDSSNIDYSNENSYYISTESKIPEVNSEITRIWYRRAPMPTQFKDKRYLQNEYKTFHDGFLHALKDSKWLGYPLNSRIAETKPINLSIANKIGFSIPDTIISAYIPDIVDFMITTGTSKQYCLKPLRAGAITKAPFSFKSRMLTIEEFILISDHVDKIPIIVQEYVPKDYEVRVTVVENSFYAAKIISQNSKDITKYDFRYYGKDIEYDNVTIPEDIKIKCLKLMSEFNLNFGCFDFIVTPESSWYYLEINPYGQWLWLDKALELGIAKHIAKFLNS